MNDHMHHFNQKLIGIFETKAAEFVKHAEDNPVTAGVTTEIAALYADLVEIMRA